MTHATALSDWEAVRGEQAVMRGTNAFEFGPTGKIRSVIGMPAGK